MHVCHATGCKVLTNRVTSICRRHWYSLPREMRARIWAAYRPGQCDDRQISREYADAARDALRYIAAKEGREPDTRVYDMPDP